MGKCLRSCKQQRSPAPEAVEAAAYLTLRSGRRVPPAASPRRRHRRGGGRRCGNGAAASASAARQRRRRVLRSRGGPEEEEEELPSSQEDSGVCNQSCGDRRETPHSGEVKHGHGNNGVAARPSSPPEEEIEAFFAAAELAERRRFAATYNYDVALDRPFEGRYEWAPVTEHVTSVSERDGGKSVNSQIIRDASGRN